MKPNPKYLNIFRTEAVDLVQRIASQLLELEGGGADIGALRQDLHTLKGSSRLVGLAEVGKLVHALETFAQDGGALVAGETRAVDLALEVLDHVEGLSGLGKPEPTEEEVQGVLARLENFQAEPPPPAPAKEAAPEEKPAPAVEPIRRQAELSWEPSAESVRVTVEVLDQLLNLSGELLLQHQRMVARFDQGQQILRLVDSLRERDGSHPSTLEPVSEALEEMVSRLEGDMVDAGFLFSEVRERTADIRMQPLSSLFETLERQVRAEARRLGKPLRFQVSGARLQLDRTILEQLKPVMVHCLTNSVVHGIEPVDLRVTAGKPEEGCISVAATSDGNRIQICIEDDGRGLDPGILRRAAVDKGFLSDEAAEEMADDEALSLIFTPGFSTAKVVGNMAGRGVGMDAVRANVERLRGQLRVESEQGCFTRITLVLPASIGVIRGLTVELRDEEVVLPAGDIRSTFSGRSLELDLASGMARTPRGELPVVSLAELMGWEEPPAGEEESWAIELEPGEEGSISLLVEAVHGEEEIVLKHPGEILAGISLIAGATILGEGRPAVILSTPEVRRLAWELHERRHPDGAIRANAPAPGPMEPGEIAAAEEAPEPDAAAEESPGDGEAPARDGEAPVEEAPSILVADDSETARNLLQDSLEAGGFQVLMTVDGRQALDRLSDSRIRALVTDFDMPGLDGLGLVAAVRGREGLEDLPVLMVTDKADQVEGQAMSMGVLAVLPKTPETYEAISARLHDALSEEPPRAPDRA